MKSALRDFVATSYSSFEAEIRATWGVTAQSLTTHSAKLKHVFRRFLSLSCAATVLGEGQPRSSYLQAVPETAYLSLVLSVKGADNTSAVLARQTLELVLKHIYFVAHPVEYGWARRRTGYREQTFQNLLDYVRNLEEFQLLSDGTVIAGTLSDWYANLSGHVHVHNSQYAVFPKVLAHHPSSLTMQEIPLVADSLWPTLVLLLRISLADKFAGASEREKTLMRDCLPQKLRRQLVAWERAYSTVQRPDRE